MPERFRADVLGPLLAAVDELRAIAHANVEAHAAQVHGAAPGWRSSARNLLHYLALRNRDVRPLQRDLARLGLSSLGRLESCTMHTLDAVSSALRHLLGEPVLPPTDLTSIPDADTGPLLLQTHARELLGDPPQGRSVRVMVTMPSEAADDRRLVRNLVDAGMDIARINTAHDDPERWTRMVENVRGAARELGRSCRVLVDLAGPKLRTGPMRPGPAVLRLRCRRDELGATVAAATAWFCAPGSAPPTERTADAMVPLAAMPTADPHPGDVLLLRDARGRRRRLRVLEVHRGAFLAASDRTIYLVPDLALHLRRDGSTVATAAIGAIAPLPGHLHLRLGDEILLTRGNVPGGPGAPGESIRGRVPCALDVVFASAKPGDPIWFDDGRLGGRIVDRQGEDLRVHITEAPLRGRKLRAEKGINLPETDLPIPALTAHDVACLDWIVAHADMVGLSFARGAADVRHLEDELDERGGQHLGVVLKIETRRGFERLPAMLLEGLRSPPLGVMVARGDLAVEVGFERLAELQEEILWLCEAAHVPVIWATQVLETLAQTGQPSRAEVTDAAMGVRAECVMLNKGPFAAHAVRFLDSVLGRMQAHTEKKRSMLRKLSVAATDADRAAPTDRADQR